MAIFGHFSILNPPSAYNSVPAAPTGEFSSNSIGVATFLAKNVVFWPKMKISKNTRFLGNLVSDFPERAAPRIVRAPSVPTKELLRFYSSKGQKSPFLAIFGTFLPKVPKMALLVPKRCFYFELIAQKMHFFIRKVRFLSDKLKIKALFGQLSPRGDYNIGPARRKLPKSAFIWSLTLKISTF